MLTADIVRELRKPFAPEQIKWKVQTNPKDGDEWAVVVAYIDARDVAERLDLATNGDWSNEYAVPQAQAGAHHTLECRLTVCGVTRCDVGSVAPPREGDDATKDLYSDALKRAAVQFGVASHVYRFPNVKAKVQKYGRSFFLTFKAQDELSDLNRHLVAGSRWPKYTEIKVSGDSFGADGKPEIFDTPASKDASYSAPPATNGHAPTTPQAAEARFFARYAKDIGGVTWPDVQRYLSSRAPKPTTVEGWIAAAEAVRDRAAALARASVPEETLPDMPKATEPAA